MARSFEANADQASAGSQTSSDTAWTWCFYAKSPGLSANPGRLFEWAGNGFMSFEDTVEWSFRRNWTTGTTFGQWNVAWANLGVTVADWNFYAVTYDGSSASNDPVMYTCAVGGTPTSRTLAESSLPTGALENVAGVLMVGNQANGAGFRQVSGEVAFLSLYNAVLSADDLLLARRFGYANVASLTHYWPLGGASPEPDDASTWDLTLTGTSVTSDPVGVPESATGRTYKRFYGPAQLTGSAADLYTVPTGKRIRVLNTHVSNPSASAVDLTLSIGTDAAGTRVYDGLSIAADSRKDDFTPYELAAGEKIQGWASSAATLNLTITGYEESV